MFHLAFWKRGQYHFSCPVPPIDAHILLVSDSGLIPLRIDSISQRDDVTYGALFGREVLSIGRVRGGLANHGDLATYYCILFAASLKTCVCPLLHRQIRIHSFKDRSTLRNVTLVTVGRTSQFEDRRSPLDALLHDWGGPIVAVLVSSTGDYLNRRWDDAISSRYVLGLTVVEVDASCAFIEGTTSELSLPDNVLYNIGLDLVLTDWVFIVPPSATVQTSMGGNLIDILSRQAVGQGKRSVALVVRGNPVKQFLSSERLDDVSEGLLH
jgi:hypothetical protein